MADRSEIQGYTSQEERPAVVPAPDAASSAARVPGVEPGKVVAGDLRTEEPRHRASAATESAVSRAFREFCEKFDLAPDKDTPHSEAFYQGWHAGREALQPKPR